MQLHENIKINFSNQRTTVSNTTIPYEKIIIVVVCMFSHTLHSDIVTSRLLNITRSDARLISSNLSPRSFTCDVDYYKQLNVA